MPVISPVKRRSVKPLRSHHSFQKSIHKGNRRKNSTGSDPTSSSTPKKNSRPVSSIKVKCTSTIRPGVIVFDWDDTLLCSHALATSGHGIATRKPLEAALVAQLHELQTVVCRVLKLAMSSGVPVMIITNAENNWVEMSAKKFMPQVLDLIQSSGGAIRVISARSAFEDFYPDQPLLWKQHSFRENIQRVLDVEFGDLPFSAFKQILSLGDSQSERLATQILCGEIGACCKSVKFVQSPSIAQLLQQLKLVVNCFDYLQNHNGILDLMLTVTAEDTTEAETDEDAESTETDEDSDDA